MKKFKIRLSVAFNILFGKYKHWALLSMDKENLVNLLSDRKFNVNIMFHGCRPYIYWKMIKQLSASKDDVEMICEKAKFEADATEFNTNKK